MSRLIEWLDHRKDVVGFETWKDVAEFSGLSPHSLSDVQACDTLDVLNRSERRMLASALRVSLRKLEQINGGAINWIDDDYVYDAGARGRPPLGLDDDPTYWVPIETRPEDRGTPLVGRIKPTGDAESDEDWQEEWGRRLSARFGKGYDVYALELEGTGGSIVFRNVPPWEFREGQAAVYCWNGWEAQGLFGRVQLAPHKAVVVSPDRQHHELDLVTIVRIGKVIGRWPT